MAESTVRLSRLRVLIVEDNEAQRVVLADLMRQEGLEPVVCASAAEAIQAVDWTEFAVAIIDQRLPDMNGTELLEHAALASRGIRAIIHTAYGSFESARDAVNRRAFAYVEKLGHPEELVRHVHRAAQDWMAEALQRSQQDYQRLVESVQAVVWRSRPELKFNTFVNREAEALLGYPVAQWLSEPHFWPNHIHPDDRDQAVARCEQAIRDRRPHELEYRMIAADGRVVWIRDIINVLEEAGRPVELVGIMVDVTRRKLIERALKESEERYRLLAEQTLDLICLHDPDGTYRYVSPSCRTLLGYEPDELLGRDPYFFFHPEDQTRIREDAHRRALQGETDLRIVYRFRKKTGDYLWFETNTTPVMDEGCRVVQLVTSSRDVTERILAGEALRESEARLAQAQRIARVGHWDWDISRDQIHWSDETFRLVGLAPQSMQPAPATFLDFVHPEDREYVERVLELLLLEGKELPLEYRLVGVDGTVRWVWSEGLLTYDEDGKPARVIGTVQDITDRKEAEEALRKSEKSFRLLFAGNPMPMWVFDQETLAFLDVNEAAVAHYGYTREEFLAMTINDIQPGEELACLREPAGSPPEAGRREGERRHRKKDGTVIEVEITVRDLPYGDRPGRLVLAHDVTEHKRLQKEILEISGREQRRIGQDLHDELGQLLTGIGFRLQELEGDLRRSNLPVADDAGEIGELVEAAIGQTRALARGLNPVDLEQQGLASALRELAQSVEQVYGVPCTFRCTHPVRVEDEETATQVYRIAQEALTNAVKHAEASHIEMGLSEAGETVTLTVSDDGVGLSTRAHNTHGLGLRIMDYRARTIGGLFSVQPGDRRGTVVTCRFGAAPVHRPAL